MSNPFRHIPAVDRLLADPRVVSASKDLPELEVTAIVRQFLDNLRRDIAIEGTTISEKDIVPRLLEELENKGRGRFQPVINATGVLLHTNLGRAPLPDHAIERLCSLGRGYLNLELNLDSGERGSRYRPISRLFNLLISSEQGSPHINTNLDTIVVNNNAGAVLVTLKALTKGREVLVSRGQLVEIGGGFRIPEVMAASGCLLKEVGTTNRTRLRDYADAITPDTAAILLVHPSNYAMLGFTESVPREKLSQLAKERGLLLIEDIGSGAFRPFDQPLVSSALKYSDLVTYSGDKLFGGPQAGIISGRSDLVDMIKTDPLLRALRIDKLSLIALEAVLELHLNKDYERLPLAALASLDPEHLKSRAKHWLSQLGPGLRGEVIPSQSTMGGGSLPGETIPSWALALSSPQLSSEELAKWLRRSRPSIMGRILQDRVLLDPRTVLPFQDSEISQLLQKGVSACS